MHLYNATDFQWFILVKYLLHRASLQPCSCCFHTWRRAAVEAEIIARGTVGFSGAELENLVNQAALKAAVDGKDMVTMKELEFAKDKILMG